MNGYTIDYTTNIITITADFAKKLNDPSTAEYTTIALIKQDYPEMKIVKRTHRSPRKYHTKSGVSNSNQFKNLTYENMERFISVLSNSEKYMREYNILRAMAAVETNGYKLVRTWFCEQFPDFRTNPIKYLNQEPVVLSALSIIEEAA